MPYNKDLLRVVREAEQDFREGNVVRDEDLRRKYHSAIAQQYARRMDPRTSHEAAEHVVESGKVASQRRRILDDLADHDGATAGEIEARLGFHSHKRMAPLERDGLVRRGLPRTCAVTGMRAMTWWRT